MNEEYSYDESSDINEIKHDVLQRTAHYAYKGVLNESKEKIPYEIVSGRKPKFRCCIYREREIIRQRVALIDNLNDALNNEIQVHRDKVPTKQDDSQIIYVIPSACEGCPIDRITVTSNCHSCLAQRCVKACNFDAIMRTPRGAVIDKDKCVNCGACAKACQYHAIVDIERPCKTSCPVDAITMDEDDVAIINEEKCINCGACVIGCPFGAISDSSMIADVITEINEGKNVYALVAPSIEGQYGDASVNDIKIAIKELGFKDVIEVALGADAVALNETEELLENVVAGKILTSSCCPSYVNLVEKQYPQVKDHVSTTVSPMVATARYIKNIDKDAVSVFIGPCMTKKYEAKKHYNDEVPYVLTFEELYSMFLAKSVEVTKHENLTDDATNYGKGFAKSGGVTDAVLKVVAEKGLNIEIKANKCNGIQECKKALTLLKVGKCTDNFIEGMACVGGCMNGPAKVNETKFSVKVFDKYKTENKNSDIINTNKNIGLDKLDVHRH